jgi:hypothetical protein
MKQLFRKKFSWMFTLAIAALMIVPFAAFASDVAVAVVDVTVPNNAVTLAPGASGNITINMTVTGAQAGTATFEVNRNWTLSGGIFTGSNPQEFTVGPRAGGDPATTFSTSGTVTAAAGQAAGTFTLAVSAFDITNSNPTGAKLADGADSNYQVTVSAPPPPSDTTPPVISYVLTPSNPDGSNGWYKSNVSLVWTVTDGESTVTKTGCVDQNITADQDATTYSCSATSAGGSTGPVNVTIKRDATAPTDVSGAPDRAPDSGTWYNHTVGVDFTGLDATSGIASCTTTNYSGPDSSAVTANGSCTDNAGNSSNGVSSAFNYDGSAPTGVALSVTAGTAGANGWYTSDVTVSTTGTDTVSGVTCTADQFQTTETGGTVFNGSCTNGAGLMTNAAPLTVKLDKTGPSAALSAAGTLGSNGWYTSDVTVSTSGSDSISNPTTCTADQSQTTDTTSATFNGSCTNDAGLSTNAASLTIKRDATPPTTPVISGVTNYYFGGTPGTASCTATDVTSGLASCNVNGYGASGVGTYVATATATDNAGNTSTATASYSVLAWTLKGFYQPVDMGILNNAKAGSTVPLKFEVFAGATELINPSIVQTFTQKISCASGVGDDIEAYATGSTSLRYDATAGQFIFNWQTPKAAGSCYRVSLTTQDGTSIFADFRLK